MIPDLNEQANEEVKILLKKNLEISEENHRLLKSIKNSSRFQQILWLIYFIFIVGGLAWSYFFFQPYFDQIKGTYTSYKENQSKIIEVFDKFIPANKN